MNTKIDDTFDLLYFEGQIWIFILVRLINIEVLAM